VKFWCPEEFLRRVPTADGEQGSYVPHTTEVISRSDDRVGLRLTVDDGVVVDVTVIANVDSVDIRMSAHNPQASDSHVQSALCCLRVADFAGVVDEFGGQAYREKGFVLVDGVPRRLSDMPPTVAGSRESSQEIQYFFPPGAAVEDVYLDGRFPYPHSPVAPSDPLIGCFSADESTVLALAWERCQYLSQLWLVCLHADPLIGGLAPGETKAVNGKIYVASSIDELLSRYAVDRAGWASQATPE
jgi:hypothetical protein